MFKDKIFCVVLKDEIALETFSQYVLLLSVQQFALEHVKQTFGYVTQTFGYVYKNVLNI